MKEKFSVSEDSSINCEVSESIEHYSPAEWNQTVSNFFLTHEYLHAVEQSRLAGMTYRYVRLFHRGHLKAVLYFQQADLSSRDMGSILNLDTMNRFAASAAEKINCLLLGTRRYAGNLLLVCGNLLVTGSHGIAVEKDFENKLIKVLPEIIRHLIASNLEKKYRTIAVTVKDFPLSDSSDWSALIKDRFHRMVIDPAMTVFLDTDWKTFDDYIQSLSSKYRVRAQKAIKKMDDVTVSELSLAEAEQLKEVIENLYLNVQKKSPVRIVRADAGYFISHKRILGDRFVIKVFRKNDEVIAFTSRFVHDSNYDAHFIGIDYRYNQSHSLYLNILYDFIHAAIKARSEKLNYGRTALEIKSTVGARPQQLFAFLKLNNRVLNVMMKPLVPSSPSGNWTQRNPFREDQVKNIINR